MLAPHAIGTPRLRRGPGRAADDVLGEVDGGFAVAMRTLDLFRPSVGAFAVGMAQAALDAAVAWTTTREVYGEPLVRQQSVAHTLAEMATRIRASRLLVHAAASAYDAGAPAAEITTQAAMAKLFATETAQWVVDQAVQLHGARALQRGHLLERLYREVRAPRIYEGASEVQRTIIGRGRRPRGARRESSDPLPGIVPLTEEWQHFRLRGGGRRRHGDARTVPRSSTRSPSRATPTCATCSHELPHRGDTSGAGDPRRGQGLLRRRRRQRDHRRADQDGRPRPDAASPR